jgi:hypothetical protein
MSVRENEGPQNTYSCGGEGIQEEQDMGLKN